MAQTIGFQTQQVKFPLTTESDWTGLSISMSALETRPGLTGFWRMVTDGRKYKFSLGISIPTWVLSLLNPKIWVPNPLNNLPFQQQNISPFSQYVSIYSNNTNPLNGYLGTQIFPPYQNPFVQGTGGFPPANYLNSQAPSAFQLPTTFSILGNIIPNANY